MRTQCSFCFGFHRQCNCNMHMHAVIDLVGFLTTSCRNHNSVCICLYFSQILCTKKSITTLIHNLEKIRIQGQCNPCKKKMRVCCLKAVMLDNEVRRRDKRISSSGDEEERGYSGGGTSSKSGRGACTTANVLIVCVSFIVGMRFCSSCCQFCCPHRQPQEDLQTDVEGTLPSIKLLFLFGKP